MVWNALFIIFHFSHFCGAWQFDNSQNFGTDFRKGGCQVLKEHVYVSEMVLMNWFTFGACARPLALFDLLDFSISLLCCIYIEHKHNRFYKV